MKRKNLSKEQKLEYDKRFNEIFEDESLYGYDAQLAFEKLKREFGLR